MSGAKREKDEENNDKNGKEKNVFDEKSGMARAHVNRWSEVTVFLVLSTHFYLLQAASRYIATTHTVCNVV